MYVWPCAVVLAQYVWTQRGEMKHKTILEVRLLISPLSITISTLSLPLGLSVLVTVIKFSPRF